MASPPQSQNRTLLQSFEWHTPSDPPGPQDTHSPCSHYTRLTALLPELSKIGITSLWLPPGCKAMNRDGNGYDIYDLWDLGEFERHGARSTKWGSKEELLDLMRSAKELDLEIIWDTVLSHKTGADATEEVWAAEVDKDDRRFEIAGPRKIEAWLKFGFPARHHSGRSASQMYWHGDHFNGVDYDNRSGKHGIFKLISESTAGQNLEVKSLPNPTTSIFSRWRPRFGRARTSESDKSTRPKGRSVKEPPKRSGKGWAEDVDDQNGNNDFLMFANIDYTNEEVRRDVRNWASWMIYEVGVNGFRLDAVQHISYSFIRDWIRHAGSEAMNKGGWHPFIVGEVWTGELKRIEKWLDAVQPPSRLPQVHVFDAPLLYNFSHLSEAIRENVAVQRRGKGSAASRAPPLQPPDLRTLLRETVVASRPEAAVTLVTNHDTQPGQTSYTPMDSRLKPLFYAFILLRPAGLPSVFWGDLFGTCGPHEEPPVGIRQKSGSSTSLILDLMMCRKNFAYGRQTDYFESPSYIGWTRAGDSTRPGCAVVLSIATKSLVNASSRSGVQTSKQMRIGNPGETWYDVLRHVDGDVIIDAKGHGTFPVRGPGVSVFVNKDAAGVEQIPVSMDPKIYKDSL